MKTLAALSLSPAIQALPMPEGLRREFGWSGLEAHTEISTEMLSEILAELAVEDCGHSWRTHLTQGRTGAGEINVESLLERTQAHRPTALFVYRARLASGSLETVALAAISERVGGGFRHSGFPVLARCFIRRAFRGRGLYPHLVLHRMRLCHSHWGPELRAVHIGAATPSIRAALAGCAELEPGFVHVGDELLQVAGQQYRVEDLVASTSAFRAQLQAALPRETDAQRAMGASLDAFLTRGVLAVSHGQLRSDWESLELETPEPLQQLFDLLDGIGVLR